MPWYAPYQESCDLLQETYQLAEKAADYYFGSFADANYRLLTFSLHPLKTITTGEGGIVTTNKKKIFDNLYNSRSHGIIKSKKNHWIYNIKNPGFNYRLSDINCALGISQLKKIKLFLNSRKKIAKIYADNLNNLKHLNFFKHSVKIRPSFHLFIINVNFKKLKKNKNDLLKFLRKNKIISQYHYIPIYRFKIYKYKFKKNFFLGSEKYFKNSLSLPIFYNLKFNQQKKIIFKLKSFLDKSS